MMSEADKVKLYETLYKDLVSLASVAGVTEDDLQKYFAPKNDPAKNNLYRLCVSLQNSGVMRNSIKFNDKGYEENIKTVLCGFDAGTAANKYAKWEDIYNAIIDTGISDNGSREKRETNWGKYCRGLYGGLNFLINKNGENEINKLVTTTELTDENIGKVRKISEEIHGLGFALTCDWLKECGCAWLAKPDVHIKEVVKHLTGKNTVKDKDVLQEMFLWTDAVNNSKDKNGSVDPNLTAYKLDKIIWLLCTGEFYLDNKRIGREAIYHKIDMNK